MSNRRFWLLTLVGLAVITLALGWAVNRYSIERKIEFASERLALLGTLRKDALQRYLTTAQAELRFWSTNELLVNNQQWLVEAWDKAITAGEDPAQALRQRYIDDNPFPDGQRHRFDDEIDNEKPYRGLHAKLHPMTKLFVMERGYYDLFLISPTGNIHYSVTKEDEFGGNLISGPYRDSGLAQVFQQILADPDTTGIAISDLQAYAPSDGAPALFIAQAMRSPEEEFIGVIVLQLPTDKILEIMNFDTGMGRTGETYLVGQDQLMHSQSRFIDTPTVLVTRAESETIRRALQGENGVSFATDYRGVEVLSAYSNIQVGETNWAVMAEVDKLEIYEQATSDQPMLAGLMLFLYSLGIWSAWFVQRADGDYDQGSMMGDLDVGMDGDG